MSADTPENKAVEAMARAMQAQATSLPVSASTPLDHDFVLQAVAALPALAETITDEMAERGGRVQLRALGLADDEIDRERAADSWTWRGALDEARACFAEMCRAAAGEK